MRRIQGSPVSIIKQSSIIVDELIKKIVQSVLEDSIEVGGQPITDIFKNVYNENYQIYQGKCYQQYSPNLCGYHAIFNTFCFLKILGDGKSQYNIENVGSFWRFKVKVQKFLFHVKNIYNINDDKWPWRDNDIREGDYERTHNKICMQKFEQFSIFHKHQKFIYLTHTWQFQYQNLLLQNDSKRELTLKFKTFRQYTGQKLIVLHLMLAITTHWLTFLAIRHGNIVQYWFFDSHNHHYLDFGWKQIVEFIQRKSQERTKYGKPQLTKFQKQSYSMCIKDIQISLKLIIDCLEGRKTLDSYSYNHKFYLFASPLEAAMAVDYDSVALVLKQYKHNIRAFFKEAIQWELLDSKGHILIKKIIQLGNQIKHHSQEGKYFYALVKNINKMPK